MRISLLFCVLVSLFTVPVVSAQSLELCPSFGYRYGGSFPLVNPTLNPNVKEIEVRSNISYGIALGVLPSEYVQVEFSWMRHDTSFAARSRIDGSTKTLFGGYLDSYLGNVLIIAGDGNSSVRPFVLVGAGATNVQARAPVDGATQFTFNLGGGLKMYLTRMVGLRFQARWSPIRISSHEDLFCNASSCYSVEDSVNAQQAEVSVGVFFRF